MQCRLCLVTYAVCPILALYAECRNAECHNAECQGAYFYVGALKI
jgi:hypothetical protein